MKGRQKRRTCFYCSKVTQRHEMGRHLGKPVPDYARTIDHVFPARFRTPDNRHHMVACCHYCNNDKGQRHPLRWLAIMPAAGVDRFARLLLLTGLDPVAINEARGRRNARKRYDSRERAGGAKPLEDGFRVLCAALPGDRDEA